MDRYQHSGSEFKEQILEELRVVLSEALGADARVRTMPGLPFASNAGSVPDGLIEISTPSKTLMIYVEVKKNVYPRDIRDAAWQLNNSMRYRDIHYETIGMMAAESLSPGAKQELRSQNIASFELGGSLYLKHDCWLINIEKASKRAKKTAHGIELFTDARESVIHALLMNSNVWLRGVELSQLAETSPYTCSLVLQELTLREWVDSVGGGPSKRRKLVQPEKLLDAWAEQWQTRKERQTKWYTFVENPKHLLSYLAEQIDRHGVDFRWAFTGTAAANAVAPLLTSTDSVEIIVPKGYAEKMASVLDLKPATKGANVTLIEREAASLLYRNSHPEYPAYFASMYILYLDLLDGRGRNKELAEHLRNHLESLWARNQSHVQPQATTLT